MERFYMCLYEEQINSLIVQQLRWGSILNIYAEHSATVFMYRLFLRYCLMGF